MSTTALRQAGATQSASKGIIDLLRNDKVAQGLRAVATKYLSHDRILKLATNAISKTPDLQRCTPQSILGAIMTTTALALEPNTVEQQAFLIPYKKRVCINGNWVEVYICEYQIGYRGYITLAHRLPGMGKFQSEAIHTGDKFTHQLGSETFLKYEKALVDRGGLIGSFCYTEIGGAEAATVLPLDEIIKIRGRSETHRSLTRRADEARRAFESTSEGGQKKAQKDLDYALAKLSDTPWEMWVDDMAGKSAIKKHCKKLPKAMGAEGSALGIAAEIDGDSSKLIDIGQMADPDFAKAVMAGEESVPEENDAVTHEEQERVDLNIVNTKQGEKVAASNESQQDKAAAQQKTADVSDMSDINME